mmetsp:Transcript_27310/g.62919  ORF Transcript_27310/g.62919 Transcript_27310/m.62919 type:complete len:245 (-) Transcript_27310:73-807(-)
MSSTADDDLEARYAWWHAYWAQEVAEPHHCALVTSEAQGSAPPAARIPKPRFQAHSKRGTTPQLLAPCDTPASSSSRQVATDTSQPNVVLAPNMITEMGITSLMFTGLPPHVTQQILKNNLDVLGFESSYDYLHVPQSTKRGSAGCKGYAFVNFLDSSMAARFCDLVYKTSCLGLAADGTPVQVKAARLQGFDALANQPSNLRALHSLGAERLPFVATAHEDLPRHGLFCKMANPSLSIDASFE